MRVSLSDLLSSHPSIAPSHPSSSTSTPTDSGLRFPIGESGPNLDPVHRLEANSRMCGDVEIALNHAPCVFPEVGRPLPLHLLALSQPSKLHACMHAVMDPCLAPGTSVLCKVKSLGSILGIPVRLHS